MTGDTQPLAGLLRTHWMLASCVVCGHERVHGERHRATCPTCGATLHSFPLYRDLQAQRCPRTASPAARQLAAKISRAFDHDQQLAIRLNDAHRRLLAANDRLWSGLRPEGLAAI